MTPTTETIILYSGVILAIVVIAVHSFRDDIIAMIADWIEPKPEMIIWQDSCKISNKIARASTARQLARIDEDIKLFESRHRGNSDVSWYVNNLKKMVCDRNLMISI